MANAAQTGKKLLHIFDLKGSIINREVKNPDYSDSGATWKDVNLLKLCKENVFLKFRRTDMHSIMERMLKDIYFMSEHNIMDYSLLLIIEIN